MRKKSKCDKLLIKDTKYSVPNYQCMNKWQTSNFKLTSSKFQQQKYMQSSKLTNLSLATKRKSSQFQSYKDFAIVLIVLR